MTETRAAYNVTMQPGPELDALVARVMGDKLSYIPDYSTRISPAMQAWTWLENNHPWKGNTLALMRNDGKPSVTRLMGYDLFETIATGNDYPHAIALAVVEAGKWLC